MDASLLSLLPDRPPPAALDFGDRLLLVSMRHWLKAAQSGQPVTASLRRGLIHFGAAETAGAVSAFMEEAAAAWPEALRLYPLGCGCIISDDEWLLIALVRDAGRRDRNAFDWRVSEMIGRSARDRLWAAAARLAANAGRQ